MSSGKPPEGFAVGNKRPNERGRGGEEVIGQKIPNKVLDKIHPDLKNRQ